MEPTFFATPDDFRAWLQEHHETESELLVGFHRKGSGRPSITWPQSVDQALCFGWIDGVRRRIDDESELTAEGLMRSEGVAAFERRSDDRTAIYAYEQRKAATLEPEQEQRFKADNKAWAWYTIPSLTPRRGSAAGPA